MFLQLGCVVINYIWMLGVVLEERWVALLYYRAKCIATISLISAHWRKGIREMAEIGQTMVAGRD